MTSSMWVFPLPVLEIQKDEAWNLMGVVLSEVSAARGPSAFSSSGACCFQKHHWTSSLPWLICQSLHCPASCAGQVQAPSSVAEVQMLHQQQQLYATGAASHGPTQQEGLKRNQPEASFEAEYLLSLHAPPCIPPRPPLPPLPRPPGGPTFSSCFVVFSVGFDPTDLPTHPSFWHADPIYTAPTLQMATEQTPCA